MKVTVVGASGLIGTKVCELLEKEGEDVVAASRRSKVDVLTGAGLANALAGADALVDVTNSPSYENRAVMDFFTTSTANLLRAAWAAGVKHYVLLSIVGVDGLPDSGYLNAKIAQEKLVVESGLPYTIVRATQVHEFAGAIVDSMVVGDEVRVPDALIQPVASDEVAAFLAEVSVSPPRNHVVNIGGPKKMTFADLARAVIGKRTDALEDELDVVVDRKARYFGTRLHPNSLVTADGALLANIPFGGF